MTEKDLGKLADTKRPAWLHYPDSMDTYISMNSQDFSPWHIPKASVVESFYNDLKQAFRSRDLVPFAQRFDSDTLACFEKGKGEAIFLIDTTAREGLEEVGEFNSLKTWHVAASKEAHQAAVELLESIKTDTTLTRNFSWGEPRAGHLEGTIVAHIEELMLNLGKISDQITPLQRAQLEIMILVHDSFKPEVALKVPITDPRSHASVAAAYIASIGDYPSLISMLQYHDEPYALWKKSVGSEIDETRLRSLISVIKDWDIFLAFILVDSLVVGKDTEPTEWALRVLVPLVETTLDFNSLKAAILSRRTNN